MLQKIKDFFTTKLAFIGAIFGGLLGLFFLAKNLLESDDKPYMEEFPQKEKKKAEKELKELKKEEKELEKKTYSDKEIEDMFNKK